MNDTLALLLWLSTLITTPAAAMAAVWLTQRNRTGGR